ncbi:hypothetical protein HYT33_03395 [Candidatus Roizmanbacteria bacterium]|nr:hypothetical protein [Candidatus Roizmanbacteria bacterium]
MTLTDFSYYVRRFYPFVIVGIIIFLIIFYLVKLSFLYLETIKPYTPYTNPAFGKIKRPYLAIASSSAGLRFTLDTIEGQPVTATDTAKVFFLPPPHAQFGYIEKIYLIAQNFGFNTELAKHKLVVDQAIFSEKNQKLIIDVRNFNFNYRYFFEVKPDLFDSVVTPQSQDSENKAIDFLKSIGGYPDEFAQGKTNIIFLQYNPKGKTIAVLKNNLNANLVEVDFYRPD